MFSAHSYTLINFVTRIAVLAHFSHHFAQMDNVLNKTEPNAKFNGKFSGFTEHVSPEMELIQNE